MDHLGNDERRLLRGAERGYDECDCRWFRDGDAIGDEVAGGAYFRREDRGLGTIIVDGVGSTITMGGASTLTRGGAADPRDEPP